MKRITIGRSKECDILIKDESEKSSRKHAVITFTFFGKMRIYDTSSNGTYVNGQKLSKPDSMEIKRGDKIEFAKDVALDWDLVKDPYAKMRIPVIFFTIAIIVSIALMLIFVVDYDKVLNDNESEQTAIEAQIDTIDNQKDSTGLKEDITLPSTSKKENATGAKEIAPAATKSKAKSDSVASKPQPQNSVNEVKERVQQNTTKPIQNQTNRKQVPYEVVKDK